MNGLERLEVGLQWLRKANPDSFDMRTWFSLMPTGISDQVVLQRLRANTCGTTACAAGWMALCPKLIEEGLHLEGDRNGMAYPAYDERNSWWGLQTFFELSEEETKFLFDDARYGDGSLDRVCARIEAFIVSKKKLAKA